MKKILPVVLFLHLSTGLFAQRVLNLDSCRALAMKNNKDLLIAGEKITSAHYQKKAAFTHFLPKLDAYGTYMRTNKELSILSDEQKNALGQWGTATQTKLQETLRQMAETNPAIAQLLQPLSSLLPGIGTSLNRIGQGLAEAFRTDTRNSYAGAVSLTQPIFMGGKIAAYHKITKYVEQLTKTQYETGAEELILSTDQAYWQVVSLAHKKNLAVSYLELVKHLDGDVDKMIAEGLATKADGLTVKVKVNEAEMTLTKVSDGLSLSRMVLCQLCGIPLDAEIQLTDEHEETLPLSPVTATADVFTAWSRRSELKSLELATRIYDQKVNVTRADFLPSVALSANYLVTNPSLWNGFEKKFRGTWALGLVVKIPVWNWGEGYYKVKAAKADARITRYQLADVREKVALQVNQASFKVNEAHKKLALAIKNLEKADENLHYANVGFNEGVIPVSHLLEAQTAWLSARSEKIDAQIDVRLTDVYLRKSLGTLNH